MTFSTLTARNPLSFGQLTLLADKLELKRPGGAAPLVLRFVFVAEDIELHILQPDAMFGSFLEPRRRGTLVGD